MQPQLASSTKLHWHDLAPALALMFIIMLSVFVATLWPSVGQKQYAVVAPPSYDLPQTIALARVAGGDLVNVGGQNNVIIVRSDRENMVSALYGAGAWLVLDPQRLRGCRGFAKDTIAAGGRA